MTLTDGFEYGEILGLSLILVFLATSVLANKSFQ